MNASQDAARPEGSRARGRTRATRHGTAENDHEQGPVDEREGPPLDLEVTAFGPTADDEPRLLEGLLAHPDIRNRLAECDFRLLSFRLTDSDVNRGDPCPPNRMRAPGEEASRASGLERRLQVSLPSWA